MLALKFLLMVFGLGLFGGAAILVAYDVYMATRLRSLLQRNRHPPLKSQGIGEATRAASYGHRPKPLRVVRIASLEGGMTMSKKPSTAALDTFRSLDGQTTYRITLRRPQWLRRTAGSTNKIIWLPDRLEVLSQQEINPSAPAAAIPAASASLAIAWSSPSA